MAVLAFLALFLSLTGYSSATYCLCKDGGSDAAYQKTIDYACGNGADCSAILQNGPCYQPNTVKSHCDYAANSYFQNKGQAAGTCDFAGVATPSDNPPTTVVAGCTYPTGPSQTTPSIGGVPSTTPSTSTGTTPGATTGTTGVPGSTSPGIFNSPTSLSPMGLTDPTGNGSPFLPGDFFYLSLVLIFPFLLFWWG